MVPGNHEGVAGAKLRVLQHDGRVLRGARHGGGDIRHVGREYDHGVLRPEVRHDGEHVVIIARPASRCSTLGRGDFIRVPLPAASTTTVTGRPMTLAPRKQKGQL